MRHNLAILAPPNEEPRWLEALSGALDTSWTVDRAEAFDPREVEAIAVAPPLRMSLDAFPNLRLIQSLWAGVEVILDDPGLRTDVPLARMKDPEMERSMSLSIRAHVYAHHLHHDEYRRQQNDHRWQQIYGVRPGERSVVFLGLGAMAEPAAESLAADGFRVSAMVRTPRPHATIDLFDHDELAAWLAEADVIVNVLPLTTATIDFIDAGFLSAVPARAGLVNVARGAHIVEDDLLAALDQGRLRHAYLDTHRSEPLPPDHPYWSHPRVTITPHMAAPTFPWSGAEFVARQLSDLEAGRPLTHLVDHTIGY